MKPSEIQKRLEMLLPARLPVLLTGAPGIGKTDLVSHASEKCGMDLIISHPVTADPTDPKGLPALIDGRAEFLPYGDLRQLIDATRPTVAFLDDLGQAPAAVQAAYMQLILARKINGHAISDHVTWVAATNRRQDKAGVSGILEPVKSRFATILEVSADLDDWSSWAMNHDIPAEVIAFLRFRPHLLSDFHATADLTNSPCPRTWTHAARLIQLGLIDLETLSGAVGEGAAVELCSFIKVYHSMPSIDGILMNPDKAQIPTEPAALYAVSVALACRASLQTADRIIKYAMRLPAEFSVLCVRDSHRKSPDIENTKAFIEWNVKFASVLT